MIVIRNVCDDRWLLASVARCCVGVVCQRKPRRYARLVAAAGDAVCVVSSADPARGQPLRRRPVRRARPALARPRARLETRAQLLQTSITAAAASEEQSRHALHHSLYFAAAWTIPAAAAAGQLLYVTALVLVARVE